MVENVFEKLCELFDKGGARYRVMHHPASGKSSQSVAEIRGTELGQGAKALCCTVKGNGVKLHVLGILPADKQADLHKLAAAVGGRRECLWCRPACELYRRTRCRCRSVALYALRGNRFQRRTSRRFNHHPNGRLSPYCCAPRSRLPSRSCARKRSRARTRPSRYAKRLKPNTVNFLSRRRQGFGACSTFDSQYALMQSK